MSCSLDLQIGLRHRNGPREIKTWIHQPGSPELQTHVHSAFESEPLGDL